MQQIYLIYHLKKKKKCCDMDVTIWFSVSLKDRCKRVRCIASVLNILWVFGHIGNT